ncbi:MAG: hypothetical protein JKY65_26195 [Planctomycetes bacterium]|nr:hypothetical protein [Planctomycetota bacterium]
MRVEFCASCGGPLEARWSEIVIECSYCGCQNTPGAKGQPVPSSVPDDGRPRLSVAGRTYVLQGRLGRGDSCDVFRGRWVRRLGELVVIKVQRADVDTDLIRREWSFLKRLHASTAQGADHFVARLPQPIALAPIHLDRERVVAVYQWHSGFNIPSTKSSPNTRRGCLGGSWSGSRSGSWRSSRLCTGAESCTGPWCPLTCSFTLATTAQC